MTPPPSATATAPAVPRLTLERRAASPTAPAREGFIVGPVYDTAWFLLSPLFALLFGVLMAYNPRAHESLTGPLAETFDYDGSRLDFLMGTLIMAHIVVVVFRSHVNGAVFKRFPLRFTLVPTLLLAGVLTSSWVFVCTSVVATWWDVYHSGAQTFGLGRIYDRKAGNDAHAGRRMDFWLNQLLYAGPILGGATLMHHVNDFDEFEAVDATFFTAIPAYAESYASWLTVAVLAIGVPFLAWYVFWSWRLHRRGHQVSPQKVCLYTITGLVSLVAWGFNSFGEAFVIMNFFHAVQYLALVWALEKHTVRDRLRLPDKRLGLAVTLAVFAVVAVTYGVCCELFEGQHAFVAATLVVSVMHFWYDGFIWSVRRGHV